MNRNLIGVKGFGRSSKRETVQRRAAVWRSQAACSSMERESVATGEAGRGPFTRSFGGGTKRQDGLVARTSETLPHKPWKLTVRQARKARLPSGEAHWVGRYCSDPFRLALFRVTMAQSPTNDYSPEELAW